MAEHEVVAGGAVALIKLEPYPVAAGVEEGLPLLRAAAVDVVGRLNLGHTEGRLEVHHPQGVTQLCLYRLHHLLMVV